MRRADWQRDRGPIRDLRTQVFIAEQNVPAHEEWDDADAVSWHFLAFTAEARAIGVARLTPGGQFGRLAVAMAWRRRGVASAITLAALEAARERGQRELFLHAQTHALGFYARFGFAPEGDEFSDAGIPHRRMRLVLS